MSTSGYQDTALLPGGKWCVHDGRRPLPPVVTPTNVGEQGPISPPSDAIRLFDGTSLDGWETLKGQPAEWKVADGYLEVVPKTGDIRTKRCFGDVQLHIEWAAPAEVKSESQGRGNSGVFLMGLYEIQVLDGYNNKTYADGITAAIYGQFPPLVNASRRPGEWQTYDILWTAPRFDGWRLVSPAYLTLLHNGVAVHHRRELQGATQHRRLGRYEPHAPTGPLALQDHGDLVRYRNIWARELSAGDE